MKQRVDKAFVTLWAKRLLVYLIGLYLMAIGVVFSAKSALGVSPVGSLANVLYQIGLSMGLWASGRAPSSARCWLAL